MPDPRIDDLLSAWQDRRRAGTPVRPEDLCRDAPDLLPELREAVAAVERIEQLAGDTAPHDGPADTATHAHAGPAATSASRLGDYVVVGVLGRGGMGEVLLADDPRLGRRVAVKVMRPGLAADPGARERFLREARAAAAVRHDHVVPIYHVGEDGGTPYLVMPLLEGETLAARLGRGPLSPAEVARVGKEVAEGLAAAHAKGLVHRDVKPANIWLEAPGDRVRLLDFGLARSAAGSDGLTQPGAVLGTAAYMSPEQADGLAVDGRSDLFSLGAVLYHAATGRPPFEGITLTAVLRAVADHHPPPPRERNPAVPPGLSDLIVRLLSKSPAGRPASAEGVARELAEGPPAADGARPRRAATWRWAIVGAVVALAGGLGVWLATRDRHQQDPSPPAPSSTPSTPTPSPASPTQYRGSVDLLVHRVYPDGSDVAVPLSDPRAMPLRPGDYFKIVAEVDPPAFVYLFWIDETGTGLPVYPWKGFQWDTRPTDEKPVAKLEVKSPNGAWLKFVGDTPGMETFLMIVRSTRLEAHEMTGWFANLKPLPVGGSRARLWFENFDLLRTDQNRGFEYEGDLVRMDTSPLGQQRLLGQRIGKSSEFSRATTFARLGKPEGKP